MSVNSYGGTFMGLKAILEGDRKPPVNKPTPKSTPRLGEKPEVLAVKVGVVDRIKFPLVDPPGKLEAVVTLILGEQSLQDAFSHLRQSSPIVEANYVYDAYTASFDDHDIVVPIQGEGYALLYVSFITTKPTESGGKRVELQGYGYTQPIMLDACKRIEKHRQTITTAEGVEDKGIRLSFSAAVSAAEFGPKVPEDVVGNVLDVYKNA